MIPIFDKVPKLLNAAEQKAVQGLKGFRQGLRTEGTSKIKKHRQLLGKLHKEFSSSGKDIGKMLGKLGKVKKK